MHGNTYARETTSSARQPLPQKTRSKGDKTAFIYVSLPLDNTLYKCHDSKTSCMILKRFYSRSKGDRVT